MLMINIKKFNLKIKTERDFFAIKRDIVKTSRLLKNMDLLVIFISLLHQF